jgi:hypothetical protein
MAEKHFDDQYELLHDRTDIKAIAPLTDRDYTVRGYVHGIFDSGILFSAITGSISILAIYS